MSTGDPTVWQRADQLWAQIVGGGHDLMSTADRDIGFAIVELATLDAHAELSWLFQPNRDDSRVRFGVRCREADAPRARGEHLMDDPIHAVESTMACGMSEHVTSELVVRLDSGDLEWTALVRDGDDVVFHFPGPATLRGDATAVAHAIVNWNRFLIAGAPQPNDSLNLVGLVAEMRGSLGDEAGAAPAPAPDQVWPDEPVAPRVDDWSNLNLWPDEPAAPVAPAEPEPVIAPEPEPEPMVRIAPDSAPVAPPEPADVPAPEPEPIIEIDAIEDLPPASPLEQYDLEWVSLRLRRMESVLEDHAGQVRTEVRHETRLAAEAAEAANVRRHRSQMDEIAELNGRIDDLTRMVRRLARAIDPTVLPPT